MSRLLDVDTALGRILHGVQPLETESTHISLCYGRMLGADIVAHRTQPPFAASAMDGYAVRAADLPGRLKVIGEAAAGHRFDGAIGPGEAVRIFTGAPLPDGADAIVIQENAVRDRADVHVAEAVSSGTYVRNAGIDFRSGETLLNAGRRMDAGALSLAAAANCAQLPVVRKPRVALIATGDELVAPGTEPGPDQIIASNTYGLAAQIISAGGEPIDCGIARDNAASMNAAFDKAANADIIVTMGGASVGDHDLVRATLEARGVSLSFWKLAMQPGKPVIFGTDGNSRRYLGLPGNPVSGLVCSQVFLMPLIRALLGDTTPDVLLSGTLGRDLPASGERRQFMRATLHWGGGKPVVTPFERQDLSLVSLYATAECLLVRPENGAAANRGELCHYIPVR